MHVVCFCWKFENDLTSIMEDMSPFICAQLQVVLRGYITRWTLEKTICMKMNYNYLTTILRSIFDPNTCISGIIYIFFIMTLKSL